MRRRYLAARAYENQDIDLEWKYCTISFDSSPLRDCDTPDEIFISSPYIGGRDRVRISSGVALHLDILVLLWAGLV